MTVNEWNWVGTYGMALGALVLFFLWSKRTKAEEEHSILHFFVPLIAMSAYFAMAVHEGEMTLKDGTTFYYARFIDWSVTTPLLLFGLCLTALRRNLRRPGIVGAILAADFYMIITGLFAGMSTGYVKWIWFTISCFAFIGVYGAMWVSLKREAQAHGTAVAKEYVTNASMLSVLWFLYPIVFLIGTPGLKVVSPVITAGCFTILDLLAKCVYGMLVMSKSKQLTTSEIAERRLPEHELIMADVASTTHI